MEMNKEKMKYAIAQLLEAIGEDTKNPALRKTPKRTAEMFERALCGNGREIGDLFQATHHAVYGGLVIVKDVSFYSLCEHCLFPFFGEISIGYIPKGNKIVGVDKLTEAVEILSRRFQLQERLTNEISSNIMKRLKPRGVGVVIEARHLCMEMSGENKAESKVITSDFKGKLKKDFAARDEFLRLTK